MASWEAEVRVAAARGTGGRQWLQSSSLPLSEGRELNPARSSATTGGVDDGFEGALGI